jgi:hypothetical protein
MLEGSESRSLRIVSNTDQNVNNTGKYRLALHGVVQPHKCNA